MKSSFPPAAERTLRILELLSTTQRGLSLDQIAEMTAIPRSSAHLILCCLEAHDYLKKHPRSRRYLLGVRVLDLASSALRANNLRLVAGSRLQQLMNRTGLATHLAVLENDQAVLLDHYSPPKMRSWTWVGMHMDLHCTALGKVLMAGLPDSEIRRILSQHELAPRNQNTKTDPEELMQDLQDTRQRGFAIDDEEAQIGCRCLAAPIRDGTGAVIAAISIAGTTRQVNLANASPLASLLVETAQEISRELRHPVTSLPVSGADSSATRS